MATATVTRTSGSSIIDSNSVEGTSVYDPNGTRIGSIDRLLIEKVSGRVVYAVMTFGGFLGMGADEYTIPWNKLNYDMRFGGFRTDITEQQLKGSPTFYRGSDYTWGNRNRERELYNYWNVPPYWD